jgi:hypothetical protein
MCNDYPNNHSQYYDNHNVKITTNAIIIQFGKISRLLPNSIGRIMHIPRLVERMKEQDFKLVN